MLRAQVAGRDDRINLIFLPSLAQTSASGQSLPKRASPAMSALPPVSDQIADIAWGPFRADIVAKVGYGGSTIDDRL
jgi:hypothetical protein